MSFDSLLTHTVTIRRVYDLGTDDEYGQPLTTEADLATVKAAVQPRSEREVATVHQAGPAIADHVIFLRPTDVTTADVIVHDPVVCGLTNDLPLCRFQLVGTPLAAGLGHHLELDAVLVAAPTLAPVAS